ncbi:EamA family transporter [Lysinibacillus sp. BPa_S21]|nr:EamA family transporter [Lysinibacillus sp. BPa_S21]
MIDRIEKIEVSLVKKYLLKLFIGGLFVFISNALAVYAMETTLVTYVAAIREISIVFAAIIGIAWLNEKISYVKWLSIISIIL